MSNSKKFNVFRLFVIASLMVAMMTFLTVTIQADTVGDAVDPVDGPRTNVGGGLMTLEGIDSSGLVCPVTTVITGTFTGVLTQSGRIFRDGIPSTCEGKAYPGIFNVGTTYNYETYTFPNPGTVDSCVVVSFNPDSGVPVPCATNAHASAYLNSYDPANQGNNYLGDVGSSVTQPFSFTVPAGEVFIVQISNTGVQAVCDYSFTVTEVACQTATDLAINKLGPAIMPIGTTSIYTVTASNTGLGGLGATNVVISDILPVGLTYLNAVASVGSYDDATGEWSIPMVAIGGSEILTIEVQATAAGVVTNTAVFVSATEPDIDSTNNSASVTTTIEMVQYELTTGVDGVGSGTIETDPVGTLFDFGTVVTLTATADTGFVFSGWSGDATGTTNPIPVTMDMAKHITATFDIAQYELTVGVDGSGSGNVASDPAGIDCGLTCAADFEYNTVVTLTATADTDSVFVGWSGAITSTNPVIQVTMDMAKSITATFDTEAAPTYRIYMPFILRP